MASVGFVLSQLFTRCLARWMASLSDHSSTRSDHVKPTREKDKRETKWEEETKK
jgi:hypothetical protein